MATPLPFLLLRLPLALRCHILPSLSRPSSQQQPLRLHHLLKRPFNQTTRRLAQPPTPPRPKEHLPTPAPRKPPTLPRPRPKGPNPLLASLIPHLRTHSQILLYRSPDHTSFYFTSYLLGALIFGAAYAQVRLIQSTRPTSSDGKTPAKQPWYAQVLPLTVGFFFAVMGAACLMAPMKLIKAVWLVAGVQESAAAGKTVGRRVTGLRIETKHPNPFSRTQGPTMEMPLQRVYLSPAVPIRRGAVGKPLWTSVPLGQARAFTDAYIDPPPTAPRGVLQRLRDANASLVDAFPALPKNFWRLTSREGIAIVHVPGSGKWKLDVRGCEQVEDGQVLAEAMLGGDERDRGLGGRVADWMRG